MSSLVTFLAIFPIHCLNKRTVCSRPAFRYALESSARASGLMHLRGNARSRIDQALLYLPPPPSRSESKRFDLSQPRGKSTVKSVALRARCARARKRDAELSFQQTYGSIPRSDEGQIGIFTFIRFSTVSEWCLNMMFQRNISRSNRETERECTTFSKCTLYCTPFRAILKHADDEHVRERLQPQGCLWKY